MAFLEPPVSTTAPPSFYPGPEQDSVSDAEVPTHRDVSVNSIMSAALLSPPKLVLLAASLASHADIDSLSYLVSQRGDVLNKDLVLRILLTYLPETVPSHSYVPFLQELASGDYPRYDPVEIDSSAVDALQEKEALKKVRKLHLLPLTWSDAPTAISHDSLALFLLRRAHRVDAAAGLLTQLPALLVPFLHDTPSLRPWVISVLLPLLRRNYQYYPHNCVPQTLEEFRALPDSAALAFLLSETGVDEANINLIGRDMKGLVGPWLYRPEKWIEASPDETGPEGLPPFSSLEVVLDWLTLQASKKWRIAVGVVQQWDGPMDSDFDGYGESHWSVAQQEYLQRRYLRAALASAYLVGESTLDAISGAHSIAARVASILGIAAPAPLEHSRIVALDLLNLDQGDILSPKLVSYMRNNLLQRTNPITEPIDTSVTRLSALTSSAFLLTSAGLPCTVRRAGDLVFLRDSGEQKSEAVKFIHLISGRTSQNDDEHWLAARKELFWLWSWSAAEVDSPTSQFGAGVFGAVDREFLEKEFLKALLTATRKIHGVYQYLT